MERKGKSEIVGEREGEGGIGRGKESLERMGSGVERGRERMMRREQVRDGEEARGRKREENRRREWWRQNEGDIILEERAEARGKEDGETERLRGRDLDKQIEQID